MNATVKSSIEECEKKCNQTLSCLQNHNKEVPFFLEDIILEKKQIFSFNNNERKTFFYYTAYEIFGSIKKNCALFYEKIRDLEENIK